jgi:hypothetical protein
VHTYKTMPQVILPVSEVLVMKGDPQVTSQGHPWAYKIMPQVCLPISEVSAMRADPKVTSRGHPTSLVHGAADVQNVEDCSFASQPNRRCSSPSNTPITSIQIVEQEVMPGLQDSAELEENMGFEDAHSKASHQAAEKTACKLSLHVETVYIGSNPLGVTCMSNTPASNLLGTVITSPVVESALDLTKPEASNQVQHLDKTEDVVEEICSEDLMSPKSLSTGLPRVSTPPTPDPGVEHVQVSAASKRKLDGKEKETTEDQKRARYFWSREESKGQTTTTANIIHITGRMGAPELDVPEYRYTCLCEQI